MDPIITTGLGKRELKPLVYAFGYNIILQSLPPWNLLKKHCTDKSALTELRKNAGSFFEEQTELYETKTLQGVKDSLLVIAEYLSSEQGLYGFYKNIDNQDNELSDGILEENEKFKESIKQFSLDKGIYEDCNYVIEVLNKYFFELNIYRNNY